jgi:hypothetical protein
MCTEASAGPASSPRASMASPAALSMCKSMCNTSHMATNLTILARERARRSSRRPHLLVLHPQSQGLTTDRNAIMDCERLMGIIRSAAITTLVSALVVTPVRAAQPSRGVAAVFIRQFVRDFSHVSSVVQLGRSELVFADRIERAVYVIDISQDSTRQLGRNGRGPQEYLVPVGVFPYTGDSLMVADAAQRRFLVLEPHGTGRTVAPTTQIPVGLVRGTDTAGSVYLTSVPDLKTGPPDSLLVTKFNPRTGASTTIASIRAPSSRVITSTSGVSRNTVGVVIPFSPADDWAVTPSGDVFIVRSAPYRIEMFGADGSNTTGDSVAYHRFPLRQADIDRFLTNDPRGTVLRESDVEWPDVLPPIRNASTLLGPGGTIWTMRETPSDAPSLYDRFSMETLRQLTSVTFEDRARVVGFVGDTVVGVAVDELDRQWIRLYKLLKP